MSLHRGVFVGWIATVLLATSVLAAWGSGPGGGPAPTQDFAEYRMTAFYFAGLESTAVGVEVEARLVEFLPLPLRPGEQTRVDSFFDITYRVSYAGKNDTGSFRIQSFFDVFFDTMPSDPATGRDGFLVANVSGMLDLGDLQAGAVTIDPCFIVENTFEIRDDLANDVRTFRSRSFHHVLLGATDPAGEAIFDYGAMTDETTTRFETGAGTTTEVKPFFDVFAKLEMDPATPGGGGMAHSFFDISYAVFEPNDEPLLEVAADGRVKAGAHLRPGQDDAMTHLQNAQSERINAMFNPKEYTLTKSTRWNANEGLLAGTSAVTTDSFFDVFFKVQPQPEPPRPPVINVRKEITLQVQLEFSPPQGGIQPPLNLRADAHEVVQIR